MNRRLVLAALALSAALSPPAALAATPGPEGVSAGTITFSGPLGTTGSKLHAPAETSQIALQPLGYEEQEYLVSGTAEGTAPGYGPSRHFPDLPFTTRVVIRHPKKASRSNGTVVLEWMNVSLQQDTDVLWLESYRELVRDGFTFVGISAQPTGVPLAAQDPVRYGSIRIPPFLPGADTASPHQGGATYGESIVAQVAHTLKSPAGAAVLGGRRARRLIAVGESQSAQRLSCYLLDAKPVDPVFDGFVIDHGECAGPSSTNATPFPYAPTIPTMFLMGMAESRAPQRNAKNMRVWQIAGASHVDAWIGAYGSAEHNQDDTGQPQAFDEQAAGNWGLEGGTGGVCNLFSAADPVRADQFPQQYVHDAALAAMQSWMTSDRAPAATPRLAFQPGGPAASDGAGGGVATDRYGNPLGGLRLPQMQVPVAKYQGTCPSEGQVLIGTTYPFTDAQLLAAYPTFADYRTQMCKAGLKSVREGTLLPFDASDIDRRVRAGRSRWPSGAQADGRSATACTAFAEAEKT